MSLEHYEQSSQGNLCRNIFSIILIQAFLIISSVAILIALKLDAYIYKFVVASARMIKNQ